MILLSAVRLVLSIWTEARELERKTLARYPYLLD
jgi:hypothetical protein